MNNFEDDYLSWFPKNLSNTIDAVAYYTQTPVELQDEIRSGDEVVVVFDVLRYTKKNPKGGYGRGISYQPKMIYLYPNEDVPSTQSYGDYEDAPF